MQADRDSYMIHEFLLVNLSLCVRFHCASKTSGQHRNIGETLPTQNGHQILALQARRVLHLLAADNKFLSHPLLNGDLHNTLASV